MNPVNMPAVRQEVAVDLDELPCDVKRMLKVQWKEFVHFVEDYELEQHVRQFWHSDDFPRSNAA